MCSHNNLQQLLTEICAFAKNNFGSSLSAVKLYGSYARGDFDDESDIDVMLVVDLEPFQLAKMEKTVSDFAFDLTLKYEVLPSILLQDKQTYEKHKTTYPFFKNIEQEGVNLVA